jgi:hypothetical protein
MAKKTGTFSQRDIAIALNNAVQRALNTTRLGPLPDERLRELRAYSQAIMDPLLEEHVGKGYLAAEELVAVMAICGLYVQLSEIMHTNKVPMASKTDLLFGEKV